MHRVPKSTVALAIGVGVFVAVAGVVGLNSGNQERAAAKPTAVERGEYLVKIMGCNDCHTPWKMGPQGPEPDMDRFLSGHPEQIGPLPNAKAGEPFLWSAFGTNTAFSGPWGVAYTNGVAPWRSNSIMCGCEALISSKASSDCHVGLSTATVV